MSMESRRARRLDAIRSVSIEDIVNGRHTRWHRFLKKARRWVLAFSLVAFTAAAGSAAYVLTSGSGDNVQLTAFKQDAASERTAAEVEIAAAPRAPKSRPEPPKVPAAPSETVDLAVAPPASETQLALKTLLANPSEPIEIAMADAEVARTPKPRPDEPPIITGSIKRADRVERHEKLIVIGRVEQRPIVLRPCRMFNHVAATLRIPRRC